jgi:O-antigen ligase
MVIWTIYICYGVFNLLYNHTGLEGVGVLVKHSSLMFLVVILSQYTISYDEIVTFSSYFAFLYKIILLLVIIDEVLLNLEWTTQFLYKMAIMGTYFSIIYTGRVYKYSLLTIATLSLTSTRSAILSILLFLVMYCVIDTLQKSKHVYRLVFFIGSLLLLLLPIYYIQLQYSNIGIFVNEYSLTLFNKNFFSGRQHIWDIVLSAIKNNFVFGYGFSNNVLPSFGINASTHNLYLGLILQGGIILILLFFIFMYQIWMKYYSYLDDRIIKTSAAFLLPILLRASFDLVLLENDIVISIYMWIPLIIGLSYTNTLKKNHRFKLGANNEIDVSM